MGSLLSTVNVTDKCASNHNLETFFLLWLDAEVDNNEENRDAQKQLRMIINHLKTFDDENQCEEYISAISTQDRVVLIVSGRSGRTIVPRVHHLRQVISIYVYCMDKQTNEQWSQPFTKVKAVLVRLNDLIAQIKPDQKSRLQVDGPLAFNIYTVHDSPDRSTTKLNGHFVHSLLLIDVLLRMTTRQMDKKELISLCRNEYYGNPTQLALVHRFEKQYSCGKALRWYTRDSFLHKILNKALRTQNIGVLFLFHFVISDINRQLKRNQCQSPVRVYRGQVMSAEELNSLRHSCGDFISINSFFSTSMDRRIAMAFLNRAEVPQDLHSVLFEIDADPHLRSSTPFADISKFSQYSNEQEILFMIGSVFRLNEVCRSDDGVTWTARMQLCGDNEHRMKELFDHMKMDYGGGNEEANVLEFGRVLRRMGEYHLAEKFYRRLLHEVPTHDARLSDLFYSLGLVTMDTGDYDSSLEWLHKSLDIIMKENPTDYINISSRYCCIGSLHYKKHNYDEALKWYKEGTQLFTQRNNTDHLSLAHLYNNTALVYDERMKYSRALLYYGKALTIYERNLPADHPDIGTVHDNIGIIYRSCGSYDQAMKCHERSLQIRLKALPSHHPQIAFSWKNIGLVHENKGELLQALAVLEKAAGIYRQSLPSDHPDIRKIEHDRMRICSKFEIAIPGGS